MSRPAPDPRQFFFLGGADVAPLPGATRGTASVAAPSAYPSAPPGSFSGGAPLGATDLSAGYDGRDGGLDALVDGFRRVSEAAADLRASVARCRDCRHVGGHGAGCAVGGLC